LVSAFPISTPRAFAVAPTQLKHINTGNIVKYGGKDWIFLERGVMLAKDLQDSRLFNPVDGPGSLLAIFDPNDPNHLLLRQEVAYGITSASPKKADAKRLLALNRGHWCVDN
jgi:hypothetical protein